MSNGLTAQQVAIQVLDAIRQSHPQLIADNMPADWGLTRLKESLKAPRVLVTVSGGIADYVSDDGVDVEVFDHDNYNDDPAGAGRVPYRFADLAIPIDVPLDQAVFEVTAAGYDGSDDATDELVFWVLAPSANDVEAAVKDTGAKFCGKVEGLTPGGYIDFTLPEQKMQFSTALLEKASEARNRARAV